MENSLCYANNNNNTFDFTHLAKLVQMAILLGRSLVTADQETLIESELAGKREQLDSG